MLSCSANTCYKQHYPYLILAGATTPQCRRLTASSMMLFSASFASCPLLVRLAESLLPPVFLRGAASPSSISSPPAFALPACAARPEQGKKLPRQNDAILPDSAANLNSNSGIRPQSRDSDASFCWSTSCRQCHFLHQTPKKRSGRHNPVRRISDVCDSPTHW